MQEALRLTDAVNRELAPSTRMSLSTILNDDKEEEADKEEEKKGRLEGTLQGAADGNLNDNHNQKHGGDGSGGSGDVDAGVDGGDGDGVDGGDGDGDDDSGASGEPSPSTSMPFPAPLSPVGRAGARDQSVNVTAQSGMGAEEGGEGGEGGGGGVSFDELLDQGFVVEMKEEGSGKRRPREGDTVQVKVETYVSLVLYCMRVCVCVCAACVNCVRQPSTSPLIPYLPRNHIAPPHPHVLSRCGTPTRICARVLPPCQQKRWWMEGFGGKVSMPQKRLGTSRTRARRRCSRSVRTRW